MKIGIIGTGNIGRSLVYKLSAAGHKVKVANSRGPDTIDPAILATGAKPVEVSEAVRDVEIVILSIPINRLVGIAPLLTGLSDDVVVVDTSVYYPLNTGHVVEIDAGLAEASWVQSRLGRPIVKAWSTVPASTLADAGRPAGAADRIALPVSGDRENDRQIVMTLVNDTGFDAVDAGTIDESWRLQPGSPAHSTDLPRDQLIAALASADRSRLTERRDLLVKISSEEIASGSTAYLEPGYWARLSRKLYM